MAVYLQQVPLPVLALCTNARRLGLIADPPLVGTPSTSIISKAGQSWSSTTIARHCEKKQSCSQRLRPVPSWRVAQDVVADEIAVAYGRRSVAKLLAVLGVQELAEG